MELGLSVFIVLTAFTLHCTSERKFNLVDGGSKLKCVNCETEIFEISTFAFNDDFRELDVSSSKVHTIKPFAFRNLKNLEFIFLENNNIATIDQDAFGGLPMILTELNLGHNKLRNLTDGFLNGFGASIIALNHNELVEVPDMVFRGLYGTVILDLSYNNISILHPDSLKYLSNLEILYLEGNDLRSLPIGVFKHTRSLKTLNMAHNKFAFFHFSLFSPISNLTHLNISHNRLEKFTPDPMLSLWKIKLLDISNNCLKDVHVITIKMFMPTLKWLVINDNFWTCHHLKTIIRDLKNNKIDVTSYTLHRYDITNVNGIACLDSQEIIGKDKTLTEYLNQIELTSNFIN